MPANKIETCKARVPFGSMGFRRCKLKAGPDGLCRIHSDEGRREREKRSAEHWEQKRKKETVNVLHNRIRNLEAEIARLKSALYCPHCGESIRD